jgi:RND family efflux transporter MFP subunit
MNKGSPNVNQTLAREHIVKPSIPPQPQLADEEEPRSASEPSRSSARIRRRLSIVVVVALAAVAAWQGYVWLAPRAKNAEGRAAATDGGGGNGARASLGFVAGDPGKTGRAARVETVRLEVVPRCDILRLTGSLAADERSSVASNTSGIVAEVRVDRGSLVRKDDVLVQIDPTDAKNKLAEGQAMLDELRARLGIDETTKDFNPEDEPEVRLAKASVDLAASNLRRAREMFAKKVISTEAFDQTQTEYELAVQRYRQALFQIKQAYSVCKTAQIKLGILKKAVDDTTIRAPFAGWVAEKLVAVGEQITSGMQATKVVTLVRIDPLRLSLTVPQQDMCRIQPHQIVRFHVDSFPDRTFDAKVRFIAPVVTNDTRSMVVEAMVPNPEGVLRPGLFATAELELPNQGTAVFAPLGAVAKMGEVARVFVVRDGVAREQVVALGEERKGKVEIRAGLSGKEILVARHEAVHDGDRVGP